MVAQTPSRLCNRVFCEDLLDPLECLFHGRLRRQAAVNDIGPGRGPDMCVLDAGVSRVEHPEVRYRWTEQTLLGVSGPVRVCQPPRIVFGDRRHAWDIAAQPGLQIGIENLRLDQKFEEFLRYFNVLRTLRNDAAGMQRLAR